MPQWKDERITTYLYLRMKYRAAREQFRTRRQQFTTWRQQFTTLRQRFYLIECAWCKRRIGWKPKLGSFPGETSHGICPPCAADMVRGIAQPRLPPHSIY